MNSLREDAIWVYLHPCLSRLVERKWRVGLDEMAGGGDVIDGGLGDVGAVLGEGGP